MAEIKQITTVRELKALGEGAVGVTPNGKYFKFDFKAGKAVEVAKPVEIEPVIDEDAELDEPLDEVIAEEEPQVATEEEKVEVVEESKVEPEIAPEPPKTAPQAPEFKSARERLLFGGKKTQPKPVVEEKPVEPEVKATVEEVAVEVEEKVEEIPPVEDVVEEPTELHDSLEAVAADLSAIVDRIKKLI